MFIATFLVHTFVESLLEHNKTKLDLHPTLVHKLIKVNERNVSVIS